MKIEVGEEISKNEFDKLSSDEVLVVNILSEGYLHYYKKAQKFPICFEDDEIKIKIDKDGFWICDDSSPTGIYLWFNKSFPLLVKAVEKAKEVAKKND